MCKHTLPIDGSQVLWFVVWMFTTAVLADTPEFRFDVLDPGPDDARVPVIEPWARIQLDPDYAGQWIVTGDVDGDGQVDIVSARNVSENDVHYTSAVCAQRLDATVIWRWGDPGIGRRKLHHDVACQIYDWDGDGRNEVVLLTDGFLVQLEGSTGRELRRFPIPAQAADCLLFANLSRNERATDVLVKNRYWQIWALDSDGNQLWTVREPGGYRTAHQPRPIDLDDDGIDEIMAGYAMLNADGSVRWTYQSQAVEQARGHLDACRVFNLDPDPAHTRLVLTCCGADNLAMVDGLGQPVWELPGHHFESLRVAELVPDVPGKEILVDIDHLPRGKSLLWVISAQGQPITQIRSEYCRHHQVVDWTGDGVSEVVIAQSRGLFNGRGERIGTLAMDRESLDSDEILVLVGDMTGNGVPDITLSTLSAVYVYRNPNPRAATPNTPLGCGPNFTLY
jgi:hypothetical protein